MASTTKKTTTDVALPPDLVALLQARGYGGKRVYVPAKDSTTQLHEKLVKILEEVEGVYERTGLRFYGAKRDLDQWHVKFSARAISEAESMSMRSAQRLRPLMMSLWKRFFRNTEIPILRRLEHIALAYGLDYMEVNLFYRRERARERATLAKTVAHETPWYGTEFSSDVLTELRECIAASLGKRPWSQKHAGPQLLESQENFGANPAGPRLEPDNEIEQDEAGLEPG